MSRIHLWNIYNSLGGDVGGDMAAAMAAASRFLPQTAATAGTGSSGSQPPQTEALNLAAEQHAAAQAAAAAAAAAARTLELNKENKVGMSASIKTIAIGWWILCNFILFIFINFFFLFGLNRTRIVNRVDTRADASGKRRSVKNVIAIVATKYTKIVPSRQSALRKSR